MPADAEFDTEKVAVKTYVPAYQKDEWADHADDLGMSQSEFVRTMVQAGRRQFEVGEQPGSPAADPRGNALEDRVLDTLEEGGPLPFDDLVDAVRDDVERRVEDAVESLQSANRIKHSPRRGYALAGEDR
jgi:hypothetical protein